MNRFRQGLLITILFLIASCAKPKERPEDIIPMSKLVEIMSELHIAQSITVDIRDSSAEYRAWLRKTYEVEIFDKYNISPISYQNSIDYYSDDPDSLLEISKGVIKKLEEYVD